MGLTAGDKLGPYEVVAPLGAGGMGEVYKARDTRLDRSVAVKVLPDHIAHREDSRARFEREARAVASLNHPNICTLYDIGPNYMVMELIEGETLATRIEKGAIPLEQALKLAAQIADALDRAHRAGVTHRDVKPQNIMLTRDGVKVLDFGLAKSAASAPGPTEATLTKVLTTEGTVMGTPQYMAPEQFEGKEADGRSDIWAFGAVLYEMVTGRKAFEGKNYTSLVAAILGGEPAPMAVKPFTPAWLERLVRRCLEKDPEDRWLAIHDIVLELKSPPEVETTPVKPGRLPWAIAAVSIFLAVFMGGWGLWLRNSSAPALPVAMEIYPPSGTTIGMTSDAAGAAISPDGRTLAFVASNDKGEQLVYVRPMESLAARALPGTAGGALPFWSPDNKSLAFFAGGKIKRIDLAGGAPVIVCDAETRAQAGGGDWNEDGVILFGGQNGISRVPASGGTPELVTRIKGELETSHRHPQFLPGGKEFLYLAIHSDSTQSGIALGSLSGKAGESGPPAILARTQTSVRYDAASSMLLFIQGRGTLMAQRLELHPARLVREPVTVAEGVRATVRTGYAEFSVSRQGTITYSLGLESEKVRFGWRDRSGKSLEVIGEPVQAFAVFALSPDGTRLAYNAGAGASFSQCDVWVMDLARGLSTRISLNGGGVQPHWSPDGKFVFYTKGDGGIVRKASDGSGEEVLLAKTDIRDHIRTVSPDGKALLFGSLDIMKLPLGAGGPGEAKPEEYLKTTALERFAAFSPDGRWVAYTSNESGIQELYIQGYPDKRGKWLVSAAGASFPAWRGDGKEVYWTGRNGMLMAAGIELQKDGVRLGHPQPMFRVPYIGGFTSVFQPSRDGQRFLVYESASAASESKPMVVIQNWAASLGR